MHYAEEIIRFPVGCACTFCTGWLRGGGLMAYSAGLERSLEYFINYISFTVEPPKYDGRMCRGNAL